MKELKLKNYTTQIGASRTIMEIEKLLSMFGAQAVMKEYAGDGTVRSLAFRLNEKTYKLPANVDGVKAVMFDKMKVSKRVDVIRNRDKQAYNTAWRIIKDWIYTQLSLIVSGQAQPDEIMLPFLFDGKRTLYQSYKEGRIQIEDKRIIEEDG